VVVRTLTLTVTVIFVGHTNCCVEVLTDKAENWNKCKWEWRNSINSENKSAIIVLLSGPKDSTTFQRTDIA